MRFRQVFEERWLNISNSLSILRIPLLLPFYYFGKLYAVSHDIQYLIPLLIVVALIAITDFLDGLLARFLKQKTTLGHYLDPLSDKAIIAGCLILLTTHFHFPLWMLIFYLLRELLTIVTGTWLYLKQGIKLHPNRWGKTGMALATLLLLWYLLQPYLERQLPQGDWLLHPEILAYIWLAAILIAGISSIFGYRNVIFPLFFSLFSRKQ